MTIEAFGPKKNCFWHPDQKFLSLWLRNVGVFGDCRKKLLLGFAGRLRRRAVFGRIPLQRPGISIGIGVAFATLRRTPSVDLGKGSRKVRGRFAEPGFVAAGPLRSESRPGSRKVRSEPFGGSQGPSPKGFAEPARQRVRRGHPQFFFVWGSRSACG